jgi:hypothetical protein
LRLGNVFPLLAACRPADIERSMEAGQSVIADISCLACGGLAWFALDTTREPFGFAGLGAAVAEERSPLPAVEMDVFAFLTTRSSLPSPHAKGA